MPISKYFKGSGEKVMANMKGRYGGKKGEEVFYGTANKTGMKPGNPHNTRNATTRRKRAASKAVGECTA